MVSRIDMDNEINNWGTQKTFIRCADGRVMDHVFSWVPGNILGLTIDQCLVFETEDIKGQYESYFKVDKCAAIECKGHFQ